MNYLLSKRVTQMHKIKNKLLTPSELGINLKVLESTKITIGIHIGSTKVSISKVKRNNDKSFSLLDYQEQELDPKTLEDPELLGKKIGEVLTTMVSHKDHTSYWMSRCYDSVFQRRLIIPQVEQSQLAETVTWSFKKVFKFSPAKYVFNFEVCELIPGRTVTIAVNAVAAPHKCLDEISLIAQSANITLEGFTLPSLATQNFRKCGLLGNNNEPTTELYIGEKESYLSISEGKKIILSRVINFGCNHIFKALNLDPSSDSIADFAEKIKQNEETDSLSSKLRTSTLKDSIENLAKKINRTIEFYNINFRGGESPTAIFISGTACTIPSIETRLQELISIKIIKVDAKRLLQGEALGMNQEHEEHTIEPCALALSNNNRTLNFLFTYKDKASIVQISKRQKKYWMLFTALVLIVFGIWLKVSSIAHITNRKLIYNELKYSQFIPKLTQEGINKKVKDTYELFSLQQQLYKKSTAIVFLNELAKQTNSRIKLIRIKSIFPNNIIDSRSKNPVTIEGIIFGDKEKLDVALGKYLIKLESSAFFGQVEVKNQKKEPYRDSPVLHFTIQLNIAMASPFLNFEKGVEHE